MPDSAQPGSPNPPQWLTRTLPCQAATVVGAVLAPLSPPPRTSDRNWGWSNLWPGSRRSAGSPRCGTTTAAPAKIITWRRLGPVETHPQRSSESLRGIDSSRRLCCRTRSGPTPLCSGPIGSLLTGPFVSGRGPPLHERPLHMHRKLGVFQGFARWAKPRSNQWL